MLIKKLIIIIIIIIFFTFIIFSSFSLNHGGITNNRKKFYKQKNLDQESYRINRDILKSHEFDQALSPVSLSNSSFNNPLTSMLPSLRIETPSPVATLNITERSTAIGILLIDRHSTTPFAPDNCKSH